MTTPGPSPEPVKSSKRIYVYWGVALTLLLTLGLLCWLVIVPVWRMRKIVADIKSRGLGAYGDAIERLGGPARASEALRLYMALPEWAAPDKNYARDIITLYLSPNGEHEVYYSPYARTAWSRTGPKGRYTVFKTVGSHDDPRVANNGRILFLGDMMDEAGAGVVYVYTAQGTLRIKEEGFASGMEAIGAFSPSGKRLVLTGLYWDGKKAAQTVRVYDGAKVILERKYPDIHTVQGVEFAASEEKALFAGYEVPSGPGKTKYWIEVVRLDKNGASQTIELKDWRGVIGNETMAVSPGGERVAFLGVGQIAVYDIRDKPLLLGTVKLRSPLADYDTFMRPAGIRAVGQNFICVSRVGIPRVKWRVLVSVLDKSGKLLQAKLSDKDQKSTLWGGIHPSPDGTSVTVKCNPGKIVVDLRALTSKSK